MTVQDLVDLHYDLPMGIDGVEYSSVNDIPKHLLVSSINNFDASEDDGIYKVFISLIE